MKKIVLLLVSLYCMNSADVYAQESCMPYIKGYRCYEFNYFDSLNQIFGKCLESLDSRYEVYTTFKLDTNGNVVELQINELPICKVPQTVKDYIAKLLYLSNGKWVPFAKSNQRVVSDDIFYRFDVIKRNRTIQEGSAEEMKFVEYYHGDGLKDEMLQKFFRSGAKTVFIYY